MELVREIDASEATINNWKSKYSGFESSDLRRLNDLEKDNSRLQKIYADVAMDNQMLKDLFSKKAVHWHKKTANTVGWYMSMMFHWQGL